ncbi:MAG TPA: cytochrome P450 [Gemmataceae bacterium]|nr:cytochrome P450 [Gemmataceae bacterium]
MSARTQPPGPKGHWLKGNLAEFRRDSLGFITHCAREYGDIVSLKLGPKRVYLLNHPDLIEQVLVTQNRNFIKHFITRLLQRILGEGLLNSEADIWLRQRRLAQPAFHRSRIEAYGRVMVEFTENMLCTWKEGESRDIHVEFMRLALGIVAKTLLNADAGGEANTVASALEFLLKDFLYRWETLFPVPRWVPTPHNLRCKRARRSLEGTIYKYIRQGRAAGVDRGDLLSMLLQVRDEDGSGMSDLQLRDQVMTLFLAGHETTANSLSWTWYLLARHPEVEAKLGKELQDVLGGRPPTVADLPRLRYTDYVVCESMRLYPPVFAFGREALQACTLGGYEIPAGATVIMSQWIMHRHPRYFDNPEEFHPDRWANGLLQRISKYVYFPFGGGPRICIGNTFAMMEASLVLATLAQHYRFTLLPEPPVVPWPAVTLRPRHGILARLQKR